ncbi:glutamate carboxypeptidase 2-like, partial [Saccoglossus kowalevskii]|uniref:Glutamate carboxypeptidase 2-like n=1 Tax=Saccoglossus kowalevskii TaxID=10224 RepID=A0ABM0MKW1_SACKO
VKHAEMFGALGMILYSDPADYATDGATDVYPDSWWLPGTGVQRGTLWINSGDPLTPGYPSLDSAYREEGDIDGLPNIPVHPIGYNDAVEILRQIDGDKAPASWQGKLDTVYNIGPQMKNNSYVTLEVHNVQRRNYTYTTVGYIKGSLEPGKSTENCGYIKGSLEPGKSTEHCGYIKGSLEPGKSTENCGYIKGSLEPGKSTENCGYIQISLEP